MAEPVRRLGLPSPAGELTITELTSDVITVHVQLQGAIVCTLAAVPNQTAGALPSSDNTLAARAARAPLYHVEIPDTETPNSSDLLLYVFFTLHHTTELARLTLPEPHRTHLVQRGIGIPTTESAILVFRAAFWQCAASFLRHAPHSAFPPTYILSPPGRQHPLRPPKPAEGSIVYERWIPHLGQTFSIRVVDSRREEDVVLFNRWHNDPRVAAAWNETGPLEHHRAYLGRTYLDPHTIPIYGQFDGVPFMYAELYWAAEDGIAPFLTPGQATEWDRGMHVLVGEQAYRGIHRVQAWLPAIMHYLFLADSRTQRVVMEPRASNAKIVDYMCRFAGFAVTKHFDFPHKRAAMLELSRERFFQLAPFHPPDWTW